MQEFKVQFLIFLLILDVSVHQLFKQHFARPCPVANESVVVIEESSPVIIDLKSASKEQNAVQTQLNVSRGQIEPLPVE